MESQALEEHRCYTTATKDGKDNEHFLECTRDKERRFPWDFQKEPVLLIAVLSHSRQNLCTDLQDYNIIHLYFLKPLSLL